jgi:hypothetical protein
MGFSDDVIKQAWERAGSQCECMKRTHSHHYSPCAKFLDWNKRGKNTQGGWEALQIDGNGASTAANCEIVCWRCYEVESVNSSGPGISNAIQFKY